MKNMFNLVVILAATAVAYIIYYVVLGASSNFKIVGGQVMHDQPINMLGTIYTGGILVGALLACIILAITYVIERQLSISKARGKGNVEAFIKRSVELLAKGQVDAVIKECDAQRGSVANIMRNGLERYQQVENDPELDSERKSAKYNVRLMKRQILKHRFSKKISLFSRPSLSVSTMIGLWEQPSG